MSTVFLPVPLYLWLDASGRCRLTVLCVWLGTAESGGGRAFGRVLVFYLPLPHFWLAFAGETWQTEQELIDRYHYERRCTTCV